MIEFQMSDNEHSNHFEQYLSVWRWQWRSSSDWIKLFIEYNFILNKVLHDPLLDTNMLCYLDDVIRNP